MNANILLAGVGGQGILSIAFVIDNAALEAGLRFKQAEVHGMAQRGGAVQSHLRLSDTEVHSDLVPEKRADIVLSVEPLEALRYTHYLSDSGVTVTSLTPFVNISSYPEIDWVYDRLLALPRLVAVDAAALAREAGTPRAQNMVVLGAGADYLPLAPESLERYVRQLFARKGEKIVDQNLAAFRAGRAVGQYHTALLESGLSPEDALSLMRRASGRDIVLDSAPIWREAFTGPRAASLRARLQEIDPKTLLRLNDETATLARERGSVLNDGGE